MSSILKCNTYQDANGNALFSSDGSGNVTLSSADFKSTPAFLLNKTDTQSISTNTTTKVTFNSEVIDTDSACDTTTFTVPSGKGGKYVLYAGVQYSVTSDGSYVIVYIYVNGASYGKSINYSPNTADLSENLTIVADLSAGDTVELYTRQNTGSSQTIKGASDEKTTYLGGYKLIGA